MAEGGGARGGARSGSSGGDLAAEVQGVGQKPKFTRIDDVFIG
jgi:hypothetical protein